MRYEKLIRRMFFAGAVAVALGAMFNVPRARAADGTCADGDRQMCGKVKSGLIELYYYWV
ncbi:MAG TPA: hypothetical protein VFJ16_12700 [Longimicrobium sp.]|nr:hypothetical protein [Longimicrobium sp.]